jgi:hypothetical protein
MLLDAINLNNNSLAKLSHEYYRSCFPMYMFYSYNENALGGPPIEDRNLFGADTSNLLLGFPFAADSSHMEGLARTSTDINWTTHGSTQNNPFGQHPIVQIIFNANPATHCIFSAICDWNLIMMRNDQVIPKQCYAIHMPLNT